MNYIFKIITIFVFFNSLIVLPIKYIKNIKYGQALPFIFIGSVLILYLSGIIFKSFYIGFYLLVLLSFIGLITLILNIKNKEFINRYLTNAFYLFIIILILLAIYNYKRCFNNYDEFSHWGPFVKSMYKNNAFYCGDSASFNNKTYPPFFSLFELLWCYITRSYDESIITLSLHVFGASLLFIFYADTYNKKIMTSLIILVLSAILYISLDIYSEPTLNSIYVDIPMGLYYAYLIILVININDNKNYNFVLLLISLFGFILVKQISIAFYIVVLFLYICLYFKKNKMFFLNLFLIIIVPIIAYKSWDIVTKVVFTGAEFDLTKIDLNSFIKGLNSYQLRVSSIYLKTLLTRTLTNGLIKLPYLAIAVINIGLLLTIKVKENRKKVSLILSVIASYIGYALLIYIMYLFVFTENESLRMVCFERFMEPIVIGNLSIAILMLDFINYRKYLLAYIIIFSTLSTKNIISKCPYFLLKTPSSYISRHSANIITDNLNRDDKVLIIAQSSDDYCKNIIRYYIWNDYSYDFEEDLTDYSNYDYIYFLNYNDLNGLYKVIDDNYEPISGK